MEKKEKIQGVSEMIDMNFDFYSDANGGDPDKTSPTLRKYHKILWSKSLPNGQMFELSFGKNGNYLCHKSKLGEFILGSDAICHEYRNHKNKKFITEQIPEEVAEFFKAVANIAGYVLFPSKQINRKNTINQERGINYYIDDRFDLTLECIRLFYLGEDSPLYDCFLRYKRFFDLFDDFNGYVKFFLLQDLIDDKGRVKFYLPFNDFKTKPLISGVEDYRIYKRNVINFAELRNKRIEKYIKTNNIN